MKFLITTALVMMFFLLGCKPYFKIPDVPEVSYDCGLVPEIIDSEKPNLLVVGDSISLLYTPALRSELPQLDVFHNPCNGQSSIYTARHINEWLSLQAIDVVIFNNGVWDRGLRTPPETYMENLRFTARAIKATGAKAYFVTMTTGPEVKEGLQKLLRDSAFEAMRAEGIPVIDVYKFTQDNNINPGHDGTHFDDAESAMIAAFIASELRK